MGERIQFSDEELLLLSKYTNSTNITDILNKFGGDIDKLKSYVKWLYKYGGTGSHGNGSGSGQGGNWSINCMIDNKQGGGTIVLSDNESKRYQISVSINRPGSSNYTCFIYKNSRSSKPEHTFTLNAEKNSNEVSLSITKNTDIVIIVSNNDDIDEKIITTKCILFAHNITCTLVDNNENIIDPSLSSTLYYPNLTNGLNLKVEHNIYVDASNIQLNINITGGLEKIPLITIPLDSGALNNGKPYSLIDLWDILKLYKGNDDIFGTYSISIKLTYNFNGNNESQTFMNTTIIPNGYYLKVIPKIKGATIYRTHQENVEDEDVYKFASKNIVLTLTAYGNMSRIPVSLVSNGQTLINTQTLIATTPTDINIQLNNGPEITEYLLEFNMMDYTYLYYIYLDADDGTLKWIDTSELLIMNETYFRGTDYSFPTNNISLNTLQSINRDYISQGYVQLNMIRGLSNITIYEEQNSNNIDTSKTNLFISFGLQYSDVNVINDNTDFITLSFNVASDNNLLVKVHQNKVIIGSNSYEIFIPKESQFDITDKEKYHLLNILIRNVESNPDLRKYEMIIYIDGYIEKAITQYFSTDKTLILNNIVLNEGNYAIDLLDVAYVSFDPDYTAIRNIDDTDIVQYWYKYRHSNGLITENELNYFLTLKDIMHSFVYKDIVSQDVITSVIEISNTYKFADLQSNLIKNNISHNVPIFILHMNNNQSADEFFTNYFCKSYINENLNNSGYVNVSSFVYIDESGNIFEYDGNSIFKLQGSSSGQFKSKNFTMQIETPATIPNASDYTTLFTPNFKACTSTNNKADEYLTYLPENTILFKADAVDSTHANNTSSGLFINKNTTPFNDARNVHTNADSYTRYIKNCLVGFPVLIIFGLKDLEDSSKIHYYYMGIYNCNLGRDSLLNLGYYNLNVLNNLYEIDGTTPANLMDGNHNGFGVYLVHTQDYQPVNNLCVAEIQGGDPHYDFSQYNSSILFEDNEGNEGMFGDFYPKVEENQFQKDKVQMFVRNTAIIGGSLFEKLKKNMSENSNDDYGYKYGYKSHYYENNNHWVTRSTNSVPNYKYQFNRLQNTFTLDEQTSNSLNSVISTLNLDQNFDAFRHFIGIFNEDEEETIKNWTYSSRNSEYGDIKDNINSNKISYLLDYNSLVEYYTICMAFGLVDSVQKNLNIKSFKEDGPFYIAFYDMDISFSRDNGGSYVHPFAFSDFWGIINNENVIYRDFYPNFNVYEKAANSGLNIMDEDDYKLIPSGQGYDIPSSYLFAIGKYAKLFYQNKENTRYATNPNYLWYTFRNSTNSPLSSAKNFVKNYFGKDLNKINRLFFNANYRFKYLQKTQTGFDQNADVFHGRGLYSVEDWLNKRFHVLDAYFNITESKSYTNNYNYYANGEWLPLTSNGQKIYDPKFKEIAQIENSSLTNTDIYLTQSIFSSGSDDTIKYSPASIGTIYIHALDYSGVYINYEQASQEDQFICIDSNREYNFTAPNNSNSSSVKFGGSIAWTKIKSLDTLIPNNKILTINSPYLENININSGTLNILNLVNIPSVKEINITSQNANCQLTLKNDTTNVNKYPNLRTINLQNSKCGLIVNGLDVTTINAQNINSPENSIIIDNCNNLRTCNFNNASLSSLSVTSIWNDNITINNSKIKTINISNTKFEHATVNIINNDDLINLELSGFETVIINNCQNLQSIKLSNIEHYVIKSIQIINCCNYNRDGNIVFNICGKESTIDGQFIKLDLSDCTTLEEISFNGTEYIKSIKLPNKEEITLLPFAFANTYLETITFAGTGEHYLCLVDNYEDEPDVLNRNCHTFYNSNFNYSSSYKFRVKNPNTSLINAFGILKVVGDGHKGSSALSYQDLYNILTNLDGKENVASLERTFFRQSNIEYLYDYENLFYKSGSQSVNQLSLNGYINLISCKEMLWGTKFNVIDDKLFNIDYPDSSYYENTENNKELNILNIIGSSLLYIHADALQKIKNKITQFIYDTKETDDDNYSYRLYTNNVTIYDNNTGILGEVNVHNLLYSDLENPKYYITTLCGLNFNNAITYFGNNEQPLFTNKQSKVHTIINCFNNLTQNNYNKTIAFKSNVKGFNYIGLTNIADNLTLYKAFSSVISASEDIYNVININELVDITKFINWNTQYVNIVKNLTQYTLSNENIFDFYKTYLYNSETLTNWNTFWTTIFGNVLTRLNNDYSISKLDHLFNKTIFQFNSTNDIDTTIELPIVSELSRNSLTRIYNLFGSCTGIVLNNDSINECGIRISNNTLKIFANSLTLNTFDSLFKNTTFNGINSYPLPNNLFNGLTNIQDLSEMFANTKIIGTHKTCDDYTGDRPYIYCKYNLTDDYESTGTTIHNYRFTSYDESTTLGYPIIPTNLFSNMTNLQIVSNMFSNSDFEGYIPSNLFDNCNNLKNITSLFNKCKVLPQKITTITSGITNDKIYNLSNGNNDVNIYSLFPKNFINLDNVSNTLILNSLTIFDIYGYIAVDASDINRIYLFNDQTFTSSNNSIKLQINNFNVTYHNDSIISSRYIVDKNGQIEVLFDIPTILESKGFNSYFNICFNFNNSNNPEDYSEGLKYNTGITPFMSLINSVLSPEMSETYYGYILEKGTMLNKDDYFSGGLKVKYVAKLNMGLSAKLSSGTSYTQPSKNIIYPGLIRIPTISESLYPTVFYQIPYSQITNNSYYTYLYKIENKININCSQIDINDNCTFDIITKLDDNNVEKQYGQVIFINNLLTTNNINYIYEEEYNNNQNDIINNAKQIYANIIYYNYLLLFNSWNPGVINPTEDENRKYFILDIYNKLGIINDKSYNTDLVYILVSDSIDPTLVGVQLKSSYKITLVYKQGTNILLVDSVEVN